ncbi:hypothetical protein [Paenibacillus sp. UASWS1643]|uniref:hypothetical protein n=1 Tax=Paenibacillus sp. UASWS1643 TaxID=2580422 RepID=UPI00123B4B5C|nr:hypothetical protein [Paenibacillus sp. UASWS1643]KAA8756747.1 hypothetical protein FE296_03110 [Paenibacillus sp. UASWS1643]
MDMEQFKYISLRGRVAYGISCFENIILTLKYDVNDWKLVLNYLWEFTSTQYLDDWNEVVVELIPENLLEFQTYEEHEFERLSKDEFLYLFKLYQYIDRSINTSIRDIYELGISHAYSVIEGYGENSLNSLQKIINFMNHSNFPLPDIQSFLIYSIKENRGWGDKFDGTKVSKIIN